MRLHARLRSAALAGAAALALLSAGGSAWAQMAPPQPLEIGAAAKPSSKGDVQALNAFFEQAFQEGLALSPEFQTQLGQKTNYGLWDNNSDEMAEAQVARTQAMLRHLREGWDPAQLPESARLNYRIFEEQAERQIEAHEWRRHGYALNHLYGRHTGIPSFLINQHRVDSAEDAEAYISRLGKVPYVLGQTIANAKASEAMGVIAPKFSLEKMLPDVRSVISGAPFEEGKPDSAIFADFKTKVGALKIDQAAKDDLVGRAREALLTKVAPAYKELASVVESQIGKATDEDGVWKLPDGRDYYRFELKQSTTTDIDPDEVHRIGLQEVESIQKEMLSIKDKVGFKGDLQAFFEHLRSDPQFIYPNTDEGKEAFIRQAETYIDAFRPKLDGLFITKPKADLIVKRVEAFREKSAPPAFYNRPALDGSRPGIFYANLYDTKELPKWSLEAIVYHEAIPGHHMQIAIAQELQDIPTFRKFAFFGAYTEGWGLYAEQLPKELGFYKDPYSDFGRLNTQIWRAVRLVVDSGIHAKKWTRQQAIDYFVANTPLSREVATREVDRYIVNPGQATSYYIGLLKILELRDKAKKELGESFDLRAFHDALITSGAVSLPALETLVDSWIAETKRS